MPCGGELSEQILPLFTFFFFLFGFEFKQVK